MTEDGVEVWWSEVGGVGQWGSGLGGEVGVVGGRGWGRVHQQAGVYQAVLKGYNFLPEMTQHKVKVTDLPY